MLNVVYICPNGYLGGAERFVLEACYAHQMSGSIKPIIIFFDHGSAVDEAVKRNISHVVLKRKIKLSNLYSLARGALEIRTIIRKHQATIVHETMPYSHIVTFVATLFMNIKKVWYQHGPIGGTLDKIACYLPVDQVLFNSNYLLDLHNIKHKTRWSKQVDKVIPCGVSIPDTNSDVVEDILNNYGDDKLLILLAGRICSWKGYETGLKAIKRIVDINNERQYRKSIKLIIVGDATRDEDQKYKASLVKYVNDHSLDDVISFTGFKNNIAEYMKACDIFLHTSNIPEPFGLVVGEAMGQGSLVIASDSGGVKDMIQDGVTGFSYDSLSLSAAENLFDTLLPLVDKYIDNGRPLELKIVNEGQNLIKAKFNTSILEKSLSHLYNNL
jgi:glycosyltransferase involved in cell wall biosynthesis